MMLLSSFTRKRQIHLSCWSTISFTRLCLSIQLVILVTNTRLYTNKSCTWVYANHPIITTTSATTNTPQVILSPRSLDSFESNNKIQDNKTGIIATTSKSSSMFILGRKNQNLIPKHISVQQQQEQELPHSLTVVNTSTQEKNKKNDDYLSLNQNQSSKLKFKVDLLHRFKISSYFALWYALNVIFNIINKRVLNILPAPLIVGTLQLGIGGIYASLLWFFHLRPFPTVVFHKNKKKKSQSLQKAIWNVGFYHSTGQLFSMVSLGAGPVSFTHIVKALEPFFSAIVSAILSTKWMPWQVYMTLIPVVGGVGYACFNERSFSWLAFWTAMGSNLAFALRAVVSKTLMSSGQPSSSSTSTTSKTVAAIGSSSTSTIDLNVDMEGTTSLSSTNLFALVTWAAFFISVPIAFIGEGSSYLSLWKEAVQQQQQRMIKDDPSIIASIVLQRDANLNLIGAVLFSGLFHYLNNEVMYMALDNVHPVTLAVGNTMKRVFIMVASVLVFRNSVSLQAAIGSVIGIFGVLLYSLTKQHYEKLESMQRKNIKK